MTSIIPVYAYRIDAPIAVTTIGIGSQIKSAIVAARISNAITIEFMDVPPYIVLVSQEFRNPHLSKTAVNFRPFDPSNMTYSFLFNLYRTGFKTIVFMYKFILSWHVLKIKQYNILFSTTFFCYYFFTGAKEQCSFQSVQNIHWSFMVVLYALHISHPCMQNIYFTSYFVFNSSQIFSAS